MQPHRVISSIAVAGIAAALLVGCGGSGTAKAPTPDGTSSSASSASATSPSAVKIDNFAFHPSTLTVGGNARVNVTNDDSTAHTFTANDGNSFDTGSIDPGNSSRLSVLKPGRYPYHCSIHSFMHGTLVVQ
jgi:plastocyanin